LVGGREAFDGNSYELVGGHYELKRPSRRPGLMKLMAITRGSYLIYT
jgi:hypothetical protein